MNRLVTAGAVTVAASACIAGGLATSSEAAPPSQRAAAQATAAVTSVSVAPQPSLSRKDGEPEGKNKDLEMLLDVAGLVFGLGGGDGGRIAAALADIKAQIAELSTKVTNGFNQLEIDIANSRYASAQEELRPITTSVG
ncbi:MAG: hypothetical protein ACKOMX_07590, partial [Actinomycetota bacterium]